MIHPIPPTADSTCPMPVLRYNYAMRLFYFLLITLAALIIAVVAMAMIVSGGQTTASIRIATLAQDVLLFIIPSILSAIKMSPLPASLLCIDRRPSFPITIIAIIAMICSIPAMDMLVEWNENIRLPESLGTLESWMRYSEDNAAAQVEMMLGGTSTADLIIDILIVGVLAGFSEELFFRGTLQRLISSGRVNHNAAIWITAVLFSAFHMQFFGFFPRLILGAFFGYLLYWSGSLWLPALLHAVNNSIVVYTLWHGKLHPDTDINSWGSDSTAIIICSILLTAAAIYILKNINKSRNGVTQ